MSAGTLNRASFLQQCSPAARPSGLPPCPLQEPVQGESPDFEAGMAEEGQLAGFLSDGANMIIRSALLQVGLCLPPGTQQACLADDAPACCKSSSGSRSCCLLLPLGCMPVRQLRRGIIAVQLRPLCAANGVLPAVPVSSVCRPTCRPPFSWPSRQHLASAQLPWLPTR